MKKGIYIGSIISLFVFALAYASIASAQNATTNVSKAAGNASAEINQTGSKLAKNASEVGGQILNKTEDIGKKVAGGLGSLLGNASEKLKEGSK